MTSRILTAGLVSGMLAAAGSRPGADDQLGINLLDNQDLEALGETAAKLNRTVQGSR
jgi:hypothetical protein